MPAPDREIQVWFNRWFSSVFHVFGLLRDDFGADTLRIHASHDDPHALMLQIADEAFLEDVSLPEERYVERALEYCAQHEIDVLWPKAHMIALAGARDRFAEQGTTVVTCGDADTMRLLDDKEAAYALLAAHDDVAIPAHRVVRTVEAWREAVDDLQQDDLPVCTKPTIATGGAGFRILDADWQKARAIFKRPGLRTSREEVDRALSAATPFRPVMVSEYLPGDELSIDCVADEGRLIAAIPRLRVGRRTQALVVEEEAISICERLTARLRLSYLYNVQLRRAVDGRWKLIEINPRMAGGMAVACMGGVNLAALGLRVALGEAVARVDGFDEVVVGRMDRGLVVTPLPA